MIGNRKTSSTISRALGSSLLLFAFATVVAGCGSSGSVRVGADSSAHRFDRSAALAALQSAQSELATSGESPELLHDIAALYAQCDSLSRATAFCERALALAPDHNPTLSLWSKIEFEAGRHETAIDRLIASRSRQGSLPEELRAGLALHYDAAGMWEESAREFADVTSPSSAKVYHVLRGDDFLEAGDLAQKALEAEPRSAASHNNFGITRLYAGDPEAARTAFLQALEIEPELRGALYNLAIVEAFYFFDEDTGREYLERYRANGGVDDPDGLGEMLASEPDPSVGEQARR